MNKRWFSVALLLAALAGCGNKESGGSSPGSYLPPAGFVGNVAQGAALYGQHCRQCHGDQALGSNAGPPLVHKYYEPGHHADLAFYRAVSKGVPAHHWQFGDMPAISGVAPEQVGHITAYVRDLQRKAGIF